MKSRHKLKVIKNADGEHHLCAVTNLTGRLILTTRKRRWLETGTYVWYHTKSRSKHSQGKYISWCIHRIGGPANIDKLYGIIGWYIDGYQMIDTKKYCEVCGFSEEKTVLWILKYGDVLPHLLSQL